MSAADDTRVGPVVAPGLDEALLCRSGRWPGQVVVQAPLGVRGRRLCW
jgi:hypothetical protein